MKKVLMLVPLILSTTTFDPVTFEELGKGWSIIEQDERSLALNEVDLSKVTLKTMLRPGEISINCEEKLRRLKQAGYTRLDARVFQALWENQSLIPESWKIEGRIFFDGTVISDSDGFHYVLYLYWYNHKWLYSYAGLDSGLGLGNPSAYLAS